MAIEIWQTGGLYKARLTPPHGRGMLWRSGPPVSRDELIRTLLAQGCHQTDIGDALYELDRSGSGHVELDQ